jgi:hypothetical protein
VCRESLPAQPPGLDAQDNADEEKIFTKGNEGKRRGEMMIKIKRIVELSTVGPP